MSIDQICIEVAEQLPTLAQKIIKENLDLSKSYNQDFLADVDSADHHKPIWHQWGIISHSKKFESALKKDVPELLESWGLWKLIEENLEEPIDGLSKMDLLRVTALLHDLGKFKVRVLKTTQPLDFNFRSHEAASGEIINSPLVSKILLDLGLSKNQINYISRLAGLHFELGKIRNKAIKSDIGYSQAFVDTPEFAKTCRVIQFEYKKYATEIGVLFLADSVSKLNPKEARLLPRLQSAVSQEQINMNVAKKYLSILVEK